MSFNHLADAIGPVNITAISDIELVKLIRETVNAAYPLDNVNRITLSTAMVIAKAIKRAEAKGYHNGVDFVAGS